MPMIDFTLTEGVLGEQTKSELVNELIFRAAYARDVESLGRMFSRCSTQSIRLRFHLAHKIVPHRMLMALAEVDPDLGKAIIAKAGAEIVGHVMYARHIAGVRYAEVAVIVEDRWSSKGIGQYLLEEISTQALQDGIETLVCTTLGENYRVQALARHVFPDVQVSFSSGTCSMNVTLGTGANGHQVEPRRETY